MGAVGQERVGGWEAPGPRAGVTVTAPLFIYMRFVQTCCGAQGQRHRGRGKAKKSFTEAPEPSRAQFLFFYRRENGTMSVSSRNERFL